MVWIVGLALLSMVTISWYVTQPIIYSLTEGTEPILEDLGENSTQSVHTFNFIRFFGTVWGPIFDGVIILWMLVSSSRRDIESDYIY